VSEFDPIAFGRLEQKVEGLAEGQSEMRADLKSILESMNKIKGARWAFGSIIAVTASGVTHVLHKLIP